MIRVVETGISDTALSDRGIIRSYRTSAIRIFYQCMKKKTGSSEIGLFDLSDYLTLFVWSPRGTVQLLYRIIQPLCKYKNYWEKSEKKT